MKSRVEKKLVNRYRTGWCSSCGMDHGKETRLESARRRRVESIVRRRKQKTRTDVPGIKYKFKIDTRPFTLAMEHAAAQMMAIQKSIIKGAKVYRDAILKMPHNGD